jgi:hypothetical protein
MLIFVRAVPIRIVNVIAIMVCLIDCNRNSPSGPLYTPPVTFSGLLYLGTGGDSVTLSGNVTFPNTCRMYGDTVRMYFYSDDFSEVNKVRQGYLLWVEIYPPLPDTTDTTTTPSNFLSLRDVLIRLSVYAQPQSTFRVSRPDTIYPDMSAVFEIESLERRRNGRIALHSIEAYLHREGATGRSMSIEKGEITGTIQ